MAKKRSKLISEEVLGREIEEWARHEFPEALSASMKKLIPLFKELQQVIGSNEDPNIAMQGLQELFRKSQGKEAGTISNQKAANRAIQIFAVWVSECGRAPIHLKSEIDFFIDVLQEVKKYLPTEAERDALLVRKLLRENDGDFTPLYNQMIPGYQDMTRDEQIDEEEKFRGRHRTNISRRKTKFNPMKAKKK